MQDGEIGCSEARARLGAYLAGGAPEIGEHLTACDSCAEALVDEWLREPADAPVPSGFAARVSSRARECRLDSEDIVPVLVVAATVLFAAIGMYVLWTGTGTRWLGNVETRRMIWLATGCIEAAVCSVFLWRVART